MVVVEHQNRTNLKWDNFNCSGTSHTGNFARYERQMTLILAKMAIMRDGRCERRPVCETVPGLLYRPNGRPVREIDDSHTGPNGHYERRPV